MHASIVKRALARILVFCFFAATFFTAFPQAVKAAEPGNYLRTVFSGGLVSSAGSTSYFEGQMSSIVLQFSGVQDEIIWTDLSDFVLHVENAGGSSSTNIAPEIYFNPSVARTVNPQNDAGETLDETHFNLQFTTQITEPGTYYITFKHKGTEHSSNPAVLLAAYVPGTYNTGDVAAMNAIIAAHPELGWTQAPADGGYIPPDWSGVNWSYEATDKRVYLLDVMGLNLTGNLDVSALTALTALYCSNNQLTSINTTGNTGLIYLQCSDNPLSTLNVLQNTALQELGCSMTQLSSLDVSQNLMLTSLVCQNTPLSTLDISNNTLLTELSFSWSQVSELDLSHNTALKTMICNNNQFSALDVSQNTALTFLLVDDNQITSLDVSKNTALMQLWLSGNKLTSLDVSANTALMSLAVDGNYMPQAEGSGIVGLENLTYFDGWDTAYNYALGVFFYGTQNAPEVPATCTVTFKDWDGAVLKTESVSLGSAATAPPSPAREGYTFTGWDKDLTNITSDLTVTAQYQANNPKDKLNDIISNPGNVTPEEILDAVKDIDDLEDKDAQGIIKDAEDIYKEKTGITVNVLADPNTHGNFAQNMDKVSVIGAAFNAQPEQTVTLHFSKPKDIVEIDGTLYKTNNAIQMDITLDGVVNPGQLDVPVIITMPIPSGITPQNFVILHHHSNGKIDVITPILNGDGTCSFTVSSFSVFSFVNRVDAPPTTPAPPPAATTARSPQTADTSNTSAWAIALLVSLAGMAGLTVAAKRNSKQSNA